MIQMLTHSAIFESIINQVRNTQSRGLEVSVMNSRQAGAELGQGQLKLEL